MKIESLIETRGIYGASGLFIARGSFGVVDGVKGLEKQEFENKTVYAYKNDKVRVTATFIKFSNGAILRQDALENLTNEEIELNKFSSRFRLDGNAYEVYSQYSSWQHESSGAWQKLVTQVTVESQGIRTCDSATPMIALSNLYNGKNTVFHLIPNCQWKINVKKFHHSDKEIVLVETGIQDSALKLKVKPFETIKLPEVIFYQANSKTDLDAYKLHEVFNELYPRKTLPIIYNTWLYCFDIVDVDELKKQVDTASEFGIEAFMIDAGWFGKEGSTWFESVGDWLEALDYGPKGRLKELSDYVREKGMIFGMWFEPQRATAQSNAITEHPEYYIDGTFLDFTNKDARDFIMQKICNAVEKYNVGWVKFDYNATMPYDLSSQAFYRYYEGYWQFIKEFKQKYPNMYMTNCGGGGFCMELNQFKYFDSCWFTDNQGPYDGIRIIKDTLKRLPTSVIERWNVQKYIDGIPEILKTEKVGKMINCNNATWDFLIGVNDSFVEEFMKGGPLGFTCDIASFPDKYKKAWKEIIAKYKTDREFYRTANARILIDSDSIIAIEYADKKFEKIIIQVFTKCTYANDITVYPVLDKTAKYVMCNNVIDGDILDSEGIFVNELVNNSCRVIEINKQV